ncbi:phosphoglycerate mutase, partial [Thalassiosira pseudonana CCMP1335]
LVRLHLIRHGETLANVQNIVLGQGDSPLTENGLQVAQLASQSDDINGNGRKLQYWRMYCSDLDRAHRTARIVLGLEDDINLVVDARLRELAKGAREGFLKSLTYEEAMELRHKNGGELD